MTEFYILPFGKYEGKSVEQVAVEDYPYLNWLLGKVSEPLLERVRKVAYVLNNFVPTIDCKAGDCDNIAGYLSIRVGFDSIACSTDHAYCDGHKNYAMDEGGLDYPIKFDTLLKFPQKPKWIRERIRNVLLEAVGFSGRKTKKVLEKFINTLPLKKPYEEKPIEQRNLRPRKPTDTAKGLQISLFQ